MEDKIRVLQIMGHFGSGGVESLIMNYYRAIDKNKVIFDFIAEEGSTLEFKNEIEKLGGKLYIVPKLKHLCKYNRALKKIFIENNYHIVQSNINSLSVFPLKIAKKNNVKIRIANSLSTTHKSEGIRYLFKIFLKKFSKIYPNAYFYCSDVAGEWLFGNKIKENSNSYKIFNAIDESKFVYNESIRMIYRKKYNIENDFVVGTCGRMVKQKNQLFLIDIFKEIVLQEPNSKLILVGDGKFSEKIKDKINCLSLDKNIIILGQKDLGLQDEMSNLYNVMDCFILPSLYEGLPMVGVEAQINSLKCYFSDTISKEVKITENSEFISLSNNSKKWAEIILKKKNSLRENVYVKEYDINVQSEYLLNVYKKLCEEN